MTEDTADDDSLESPISRMQFIAATAVDNLQCLLSNPSVQVMYLPAETIASKAVALAVALDELLGSVQESIEGLPGETHTDGTADTPETKH